MKKPREPNSPNRGKLDYHDDTILDKYYHGDGKEEVVLYSDFNYLFDDEFDFRCKWCEDKGCEECESWNVSNDRIRIETLTLQDIIDKLPKGFASSDVKMKFGHELSCMGPSPRDNVCIEFVYRKSIDLQAELDKYTKEKERYKKEIAEYKAAKKKYDEWKRDQEIAEAQAKLDELKGK